MGEFEDIDDKELYDRIEQGNSADKFLNSENGRLLKEASNRVVERAVTQFALRTDPSDLAAVINLQLVIRKYKFGLFEEIKQLSKDGLKAELEIQENYEEPPSEQGNEQGS